MTICIKMDLALNNLQRLICHKIQPTNQPTNQVSRTLLIVLADLNSSVVWIVSTRFVIFNSSDPLMTKPSSSITIGITVTSIFHFFFFSSLARSKYLSLFSPSFNFILWSDGTAKSTIRQVPCFIIFLIIIIIIIIGNHLAVFLIFI